MKQLVLASIASIVLGCQSTTAPYQAAPDPVKAPYNNPKIQLSVPLNRRGTRTSSANPSSLAATPMAGALRRPLPTRRVCLAFTPAWRLSVLNAVTPNRLQSNLKTKRHDYSGILSKR